MIYVEIKTCDKVLRVCNKLFENVPSFNSLGTTITNILWNGILLEKLCSFS
jgi:hypothetical protein